MSQRLTERNGPCVTGRRKTIGRVNFVERVDEFAHIGDPNKVEPRRKGGRSHIAVAVAVTKRQRRRRRQLYSAPQGKRVASQSENRVARVEVFVFVGAFDEEMFGRAKTAADG